MVNQALVMAIANVVVIEIGLDQLNHPVLLHSMIRRILFRLQAVVWRVMQTVVRIAVRTVVRTVIRTVVRTLTESRRKSIALGWGIVVLNITQVKHTAVYSYSL